MKLQITNYKLQISATSLFIIVYLLSVTCYLSPLSAAETADEVVDRIQKTFESIRDISGSFDQKSYIKDLEQTQEFSGKFFLKKPARMMWEYAKPRDEKVVINDKETLIFKKSQNQVIRTRFSEESYSQVPIAMLESFDNIRHDFNITMPEKNALQLTPKKKIGYIKYVVMETSDRDFPVKMFTIFDTYGNVIMIELKNIKTNTGLKDEIFDFQIPPGAEVFDMSQ
jgi:outer membrane lipoprotein carrier protein